MRAAHLSGPGPYVFEDPWALPLTSEMYRELAAKGELADFFPKLGLGVILGQIVGRAAWNEEALDEALARGVTQVVVLGAGLDSTALRRPDLLEHASIFELDHPDTQAYKLARLEELGVEPHPRVHHVAVDFEQESVETALARAGVEPEAPAFLTWLGVVTYLTREDVLRTLAGIRAACAPGSEVALDYPISPDALEPDARAVFDAIARSSVELGEPRRATYEPETLRSEVESLGYACVEDLSSEDHRARYFGDRDDGLRPYPQVHLARFRCV